MSRNPDFGLGVKELDRVSWIDYVGKKHYGEVVHADEDAPAVVLRESDTDILYMVDRYDLAPLRFP